MRTKYSIYRHLRYESTDELEPTPYSEIYGHAQPAGSSFVNPSDVSMGDPYTLFLVAYQPRDIQAGYMLEDPAGNQYTVLEAVQFFIRGQYRYEVSAVRQSDAVVTGYPEFITQDDYFLVTQDDEPLLVNTA